MPGKPFLVFCVDHSPLEGESQKPSRQAKADAVGGPNRDAKASNWKHPSGTRPLTPPLPLGANHRQLTTSAFSSSPPSRPSAP